MWARSSLLSVALFAACKSPPPPAAEADPARVGALANKMANNVPAPQVARPCHPDDYKGLPTFTLTTMMKLGGITYNNDAENRDWINPDALNSQTVMELSGTDEHARRRAAATLLAAPAWVVYKIDMVNAPMALGMKELKIGTIGARAIRFSTKTALPECVEIFYFQNDQKKSDYAISKSDRAIIDPELAKMLREDLAAQYLAHVPRPPAPPAK
jgi:hypothetical protein